MLLKEFKELVKDEVFDDVFTDEEYWNRTEEELLGELTEENFNDVGEKYYEGKLGKCFSQSEPLNKNVEVFKTLVKSIYKFGTSEASKRISVGLYEFADILCDCISNLLEDLSYDLGVAVLPEVKFCMDKALKELAYVYSLENTISLIELLNRFSDACLSYDMEEGNEGLGYFLLDYDDIVSTLAVTVKENISNLNNSEITFVDYVLVGNKEGYRVVTVNAYEYVRQQWGYIKEFTGIELDTVEED